MAHPSRKETLIAELAAARNQLAGYAQALTRDLDFGARLKSGVRRHPVPWFGSAALIGLLLSKFPTGARKVTVKAPRVRGGDVEKAGKAAFALAVLKFVLDFAKPALVKWVSGRFFPGSSRSGRPRT